MTNGVAWTARLTAAVRALETERSDRLFGDPLAAMLAGAEALARLESRPSEARGNPFIPIRTRVFDDRLLRAANDGDIRQIVLLAAGFDSRAFRLRWPHGLTLWELDQSAVLDSKNAILASASATPTCERRTLGVDLASADWSNLLRADGYRIDERSAWLIEGLVYYIDKPSVGRILATCASLAAPGSVLAMDCVSEDYLTSEYTESYVRGLARLGAPWLFGSNDPASLLAAHGWQADVILQPGDEGANFGRWPRRVPPRHIPGLPRAFLVLATRCR
jgi:methyltransferase (TIGR00027 family)